MHCLALHRRVMFVAQAGASPGALCCGGSRAPCTTIAEAVVESDPWDTIVVGPGTYGGPGNTGLDV